MMPKTTEWYLKFYNDNRGIVNTHMFLTILIMPVEIIIFSIFTKVLFRCLTEKNYERFAFLFIYFILSLVALQCLYAWKSRLDDKIMPLIQIYVRQRYMDTALKETSDSMNTSQIMNYITIMPKYFYQNYDLVLKFWVPFASAFFFFAIFLTWYQIRLGVISSIYFAGLITLFLYGYRYLVKFSQQYFSNEENILSNYEDILLNNESVKSFNANKAELDALKNEEENNNERMNNLMFRLNVFQFIFLFLALAFLLGLFFYVNRLRIQKTIPIWKFFVFITIVFFMIREIVLANNYIVKSVYQEASLRNIETFETEHPTTQEEEFEMKPLEDYDLKLKNVKYTFEDNTFDDVEGKNFLLENITLHLKNRQSLLIRGAIGSGKSTLAKLIMKWYTPREGSISINNKDVSNYPLKHLRQEQYFMTQNTALFSRKTILENIFYRQPQNIDALKKLGLPKTFLHNLNLVVKKNGQNVSGGTKRLVHVLRCYFHPAKLIIMDEPTDNLDEDTTNTVIRLIVTLQKTKSVICISHDPRLYPIFNHFYYMGTQN